MPSGPLQQVATWDLVAPGYAERAAYFAPYMEEALRIAAPSSSAYILDVATGPGTLAFLGAARAAHVTAVDFSPGMIAELRARAAREAVVNIEAHVMDAQALALPDASFDAAFCLFGFMFFPDRDRAFREILRVLRPGGCAVVATWAPIDRRPFMKIGFEALVEALPEAPAPLKGDLQDPDECVREMSAAGFRDVLARSFTAAIRVESAEQYLTMLERTAAPFAMLKRKLGDQAWAAVAEKVLGIVHTRLPGPTDLSAEAIFTKGTR
jgi:SAM-dependent methyltransferase